MTERDGHTKKKIITYSTATLTVQSLEILLHNHLLTHQKKDYKLKLKLKNTEQISKNEIF